MNLEQLVYILEVYKAGSISNAAKNCHVTIPAISQAISLLEKELNTQIFKRSRTGSIPTEKGLLIINKAEEIIKNMEELKEIALSGDHAIHGNLNISASPSMIILVFAAAFAFKKDYPNVEIKITEKSAEEIIENIKSNNDDIGFLMLNSELLDNSDFWEYQSLIKDRMYLCVGRHSPLAKKSTVEPEEALKHPFVTYSGINAKRLMKNFFKKHGEAKLLFQSNQFEIIKRTISEGFAVSFINGLVLKDDPRVSNGDVVPLKVKDFDIEIPFGWLRKRNTYFSPAAKKFLAYIKKEAESGNY